MIYVSVVQITASKCEVLVYYFQQDWYLNASLSQGLGLMMIPNIFWWLGLNFSVTALTKKMALKGFIMFIMFPKSQCLRSDRHFALFALLGFIGIPSPLATLLCGWAWQWDLSPVELILVKHGRYNQLSSSHSALHSNSVKHGRYNWMSFANDTQS